MEDIFMHTRCNTEQTNLINASIHKLYKGNVVKALDWIHEPNPLFFGASPFEMITFLEKGSLVLAKINEFLGEGNEVKNAEEYWASA